MRVTALFKATTESEAGILSTAELLAAMGRYNQALIDAGILRAGDGLKPSSQGSASPSIGPAAR